MERVSAKPLTRSMNFGREGSGAARIADTRRTCRSGSVAGNVASDAPVLAAAATRSHAGDGKLPGTECVEVARILPAQFLRLAHEPSHVAEQLAGRRNICLPQSRPPVADR